MNTNRNPGLRPVLRLLLSAGAVLVIAGCGDDSPGAPEVGNPSAVPAVENVLAVGVTFSARGIDSARVVFWSEDLPTGSTPFFPTVEGMNEIPVLGLEPDCPYRFLVEAWGSDRTLYSPVTTARTGILPEALQDRRLVTSGHLSPPLVSATLSGVLTVFDRDGRVRWYREVPGFRGGAGGILPGGNWFAFVGPPSGTVPEYGYFLEMDALGREVGRYEAPFPRYTDPHELLLTTDGDGIPVAHFFSYDIRTFDFSEFGGPTEAPVIGHQLIRMRGGEVEFLWDAWDHFDLEDALTIRPTLYQDCTNCDLDHPNSLWIDRDGNYVVSWAVQREVMKIDSDTGEILWRLGGAHSDFTFLNDAWNGFSFQHFARTLAGGHVLLYDNGVARDPEESRAVQYALDLQAGTATLVWQYRHQPPIYTPIVGSVVRLTGGNTFVGFTGQFDFQTGPIGPATAVEVDPFGNVVWRGETPDPELVYRILPVMSLYRFIEP